MQRTTSLDLALDLLHPFFKVKPTLALQLLLWMRVISTIGCEIFLKVYIKTPYEQPVSAYEPWNLNKNEFSGDKLLASGFL